MYSQVFLHYGYGAFSFGFCVSPEDMLVFLREPFYDWRLPETWLKHNFDKRRAEFKDHWLRHDFEARKAQWLGFSALLQSELATAEFSFTTCLIDGRLEPNLDELGDGMTRKLYRARQTIDDMILWIKK